MSTHYDLLLVGGGLANCLIAWRLKISRPELRLLVLEQHTQLGATPPVEGFGEQLGSHTWSFHDQDLSPAQYRWLEPLIGRRWERYQVIFPERRRIFSSGYNSIFSTDFARFMSTALGKDLRLGCQVADVAPTRVTLQDGQVLQATAVIDGRGPVPSEHLALGYQCFLGQELRLQQPHGLEVPIIMDANVEQGAGYRFVYVLPLSHDTVLIEDTHYTNRPVQDWSALREHIQTYAQQRGWSIAETLREEHGALPITLAGDFGAYWRELQGQPVSGLRAGLFHATTGYSLPSAVRLAERIAQLTDLSAAQLFAQIHRHAQLDWRRQGFFRVLNRMLFLAGKPSDRWRVLQRFHGLSAGLIQRFYAGQLTLRDQLRIVSGKPPVPVREALRALRRSTPSRIRNE